MTLAPPAPPTSIDRLGETTTLAVSYLRVSTKEQAERGGRDEGFSIPAQRDANLRKARDLNAIVVEEFIDAGESARKADRPELMRMIEYVKTHQVAYCIVHKVDRLARNRADDVAIHLALKDAGVILVSATENIDETPSGMLLHGIMSTIAEFYSRNLANEVAKGMTQKALTGGTNGSSLLGGGGRLGGAGAGTLGGGRGLRGSLARGGAGALGSGAGALDGTGDLGLAAALSERDMSASFRCVVHRVRGP